MRRLRSLVRAGLKNNFGLSLLRFRLFKQKKDLWLAPFVLLGVAGLGSLFYGYGSLIKGLYETLRPLGQEQALPAFALMVGQLLILVFGLYYVISAFYFSRDLEMLIPLPCKPFEVILSKFAVVLVNEYLTMIPLVLPMLVYFGILSRAGWPYWTNAFLVYLLLPVIPLCLVSILVVGLMRLVNVSRKKDVVIIVGSLFLILLGFGFQVLVNRSAGSGESMQAVVNFLASPDSLLKKVGRMFPPSIWAGKALAGGFSGSGLTNLALLLVVSLAGFYIILVLAEKLFYRGLIGLGEVSGRKKLLTAAEMTRRVSSGHHAVRAIFDREWRVMNRTPIFLINGTLTAFLIPIVVILMATAGSGKGSLSQILRMISSATDKNLVVLGAASFLMVCGCLNGTASSTFSREGSQFWMSKVIPVSPRDQARAKFAHSYLVSLLGIVTSLVVLVVVLGLKAADCAAALGLALVGAVGLTAVGMMIDLVRPLLQWTNPQKAIKQNLNVVIAILADIGFLAVIGYGLSRLAKAGVSGRSLLMVALVTLAVVSGLSYHFLMAYAERRYREIEA
jgi:ABC-2 type transport system permease protein